MKKLIIQIIITALLILAVPIIGICAGIFELQEEVNLPGLSKSNEFHIDEKIKNRLPDQIQDKLDVIEKRKESEINNPKEAATYINEEMVKRNQHITFTYKPDYEFSGDANAFWDELYPEIFKITNNPKGGHYLKYNYTQVNMNMEGTTKEVTVSLNVSYHTTPEEEKAVDEKVAQILSELDLHDKSEYQKAKLIYDYIKDTATYGKSEDMYSAYGTLIDHQSVCNGYALSFYRLGKEAGLDVVCISGKGSNEAHLWNAVKLNGKYYQCDVTWDSQSGRHMYFLKGTDDFDNHKSDTNNDTEIINNLSTQNY